MRHSSQRFALERCSCVRLRHVCPTLRGGMAMDQAYLEHTSPLPELDSRQSKWNSSANVECVSALSSLGELSRPCAEVPRHLATKSPSPGICGETLAFDSAVSAR